MSAGINGCKVKVFRKYDGVFVFACVTACVFLFARESVFEENHVKGITLLRDLATIQHVLSL